MNKYDKCDCFSIRFYTKMHKEACIKVNNTKTTKMAMGFMVANKVAGLKCSGGGGD